MTCLLFKLHVFTGLSAGVVGEPTNSCSQKNQRSIPPLEKKVIITAGKEEEDVKGHLFGVPHVLNPIRQPGDSTTLGLVSSFLQQYQRWSENTTWRLCSPIQTCTLLKGYGWFDFYLPTGVVRLAERLVSRQVG